MSKERKKLEQTKGTFILKGKLTGICNPKFPHYEEGVQQSGKMKGKPFRKLKLGLKTSKENLINVQMFDFLKDDAYLYKKGENGEKGETIKVKFNDWDKHKKDGFACLEFKLGLELDEKGEAEEHTMPSYIASEIIGREFDNGDSVEIHGEFSYSNGTNQQGEAVVYANYTMKSIKRIKDIDFDDKDFKECTFFKQEIIYVDAFEDKKEKNVIVVGRSIDYKEDFFDNSYVIKYGTEDGGIDEGMKTLATNFVKNVKLGDKLWVQGNLWNKANTIEVSDNWGGSTKVIYGKPIKFVEIKDVVRDKKTAEVQYSPKYYTQRDFEEALESKQLVVDNSKTEPNFWSNDKSDEENPFANMNGRISISEDDLPF